MLPLLGRVGSGAKRFWHPRNKLGDLSTCTIWYSGLVQIIRSYKLRISVCGCELCTNPSAPAPGTHWSWSGCNIESEHFWMASLLEIFIFSHQLSEYDPTQSQQNCRYRATKGWVSTFCTLCHSSRARSSCNVANIFLELGAFLQKYEIQKISLKIDIGGILSPCEVHWCPQRSLWLYPLVWTYKRNVRWAWWPPWNSLDLK